MINKDLNSDPDDYLLQEDDELDESDDDKQDDILHLDQIVHQTAFKIRKAAYDSSNINFEFEEKYTLVKNIWDQLQCFAQKAWVREAVIISAVMIFKTGLWIAFRMARKEGIEIANL